jgi:putative membrane-bound dehydrogenase-like protein
MRILFLCFSIAVPLLLVSCTQQKPLDERSPEASLADLKVYPGLEVTLFASEPMFSNPTNMDIDSRGRVWVCEAYNYRNQYNPQNPVREEGDRIMILEDTDGDGKADKSTVFYQGQEINAALGICVLGNQVIVSCSPHVFVFTDEDGDDKADKKEILFQGIKGVQHDHAIHAFTFGHDGRLYFNMGNEGVILIDAKGDTVVDVHGRKVVTNGKPFREGLALRSDLDGSNVEVLAHNFRNNYELTVDPFGNIWQSDNDDDGNKGTRINFVIEQGNYGYKDEMTGAGWNKRRTNIEKEIPFRHWHLNDPGVVPNLLQTGAGSPTGIALYEGSMLPEIFHGQMIHAEPGHNVVRSYPVKKDGAGYSATIVNLVEGQNDQWFRPADVCVAPDGSLFIADWYDPGVGGHQVGDLDRGRIYRIALPKSPYKIKSPTFDTPETAAEALLNPNAATRYLGWKALASMGADAETALKKLWTSNNVRHRAQALWLLIRLPDGEKYLQEALNDKDEDICITGIRAARLLKKDPVTVAIPLVDHPSPQVRREVAILLRSNRSPKAAELWAQLALQYDGKDRWYLETLGISADTNWDQYFAAWKKRAGKAWNTPAGRDVVWRSRSAAAMPLMAELIKEADEKEMLRYFRAFDFHQHPSKQHVLAGLIQASHGEKVLYSLKHIDPSRLTITPPIAAALNNVLEQYEGKIEFVELVTSFKRKDKTEALLKLVLQKPDSTIGKEACKTLLDWNRIDLLEARVNSENKAEAQAVIIALWSHMYHPKVIAMMESLMKDPSKDLELRKLAVKTFSGSWEAEDRLLKLAKEKMIPQELHAAAGGVFQSVWRATLREEARNYLTLPGSKEGKPLPSIAVLVDKKGEVSKGKEVFNASCSNCHRVNGQGVNFGPDLSEIGNKLSREAMYKAILYPDQGISFGYEGWQIKLNDGSTAFGRIVSETADKIDVQFMQNVQSVHKVDVASRTQMKTSMMPSDLQSFMTEQELIDLVEYLISLKKSSI